MGMRNRWWLWIMGLLLLPASVCAQNAPPVNFVGPLSHQPYDSAGIYVGFDFLYMRTNRPLGRQEIAYRGFQDLDGSQGPQNFWIGSKDVALSTADLRGPGSSQPGFDLTIGYKFEGGVAVALTWRHLTQVRYHANAALLPPDFNTGLKFENTFLSSPVSNFTNDWAGNDTNATGVGSATTFGIWNAASIMSIEFVQRYDVYQVSARIPMVQTEDYRMYGLFGPRIAWIWDRFRWRTVDADQDGNSGPDTTALYSNTISNRLYGVHFGAGHDWFLGVTPIGAFSIVAEVEGGIYLDMVKTRAAWERGDRQISAGRSGRLSALAPGADLRLGIKWYPYEAISIEVGYDIQMYFNTIASPRPVDFNMGTIDPEYTHQFFRWYYGLKIGIGFVF